MAAIGLDHDKDTAALIELFTQQHDRTPNALGSSPAALHWIDDGWDLE